MTDNSLDIKIGKKIIHSSGHISIDFKNRLLEIRDTTRVGEGDYIRYRISDTDLEKMISDFIANPYNPNTD